MEAPDSVVSADQPPTFVFAPIEGPAPCSSAQLRMWTLERLLLGCPRYNKPIAFELRGAINAAMLEAALHLLVQRHPVLRTIYQETDGEVRQLAGPAAAPLLHHADVSGHGAAAAQAEAMRLATTFAGRSFDLAQQPPFEALLIDMGHEERLLVLSTHHIAVDGSVNQVIDALSQAYRDVTVDPPPCATPTLPSYKSYAAWERKRAELPETHAAALAYWTERLTDPPPLLDLPADRPPAAAVTGRGARYTCTLPAATREGLLQLRRTHGVTLFQALLAISSAFLARLCEQEEFCIAVPITDRPHRELRDVIGNFVNTAVLRFDLSGDPGFDEFIAQVRERTYKAVKHRALPFDRVVQAIPASRVTDRMPFANVMVSLSQQEVRLSIAEAEATPVDINLPATRFEFGLFFKTVDDELRLVIEYDTDRFDASRVQRYAQHWMTLAAAALAEPSTALSRLPLLSSVERHAILETWNATESPCDTERLVHSLFEAQARRQPQAIAVRGSGSSLTYRELDARANRMAAAIAGLGLRRNARIALLCDRSPHLIVAMLAVLKAGCAYVPLDPDSPLARHAAILRIAEASALITDASLQARAAELSAHATGDLPCLRADAADGVGNDDQAPGPKGTSPDDLAYVIFTSGTTGIPKGVAVRHRPVINLIDWVNRTHSVGPADQLLFVTSVAFDLSVYDVFGMLAAGGTVRIASHDEVRDPRALAKILENEPITFWDSAPIAMDQCASYLSDTARPALRLVFLSGDWIPVTLPGRLRRFMPDVEVIALGGATEAVVWSNFHRVGVVEPRQNSIPYGRPIQNARYHILDRTGEPVPIGVPGDLFIGGAVLADGYVGDPAQTAARFLPDPFRPHPDARLYRTGDRARYSEDGTIEFLGRLDTQVKIRGFRVEVGEVEAQLAAHPAVRASHIAVRGERADRRMCAYVVAEAADPGLATQLRESLRASLPEYMLPHAIVILDAFPLTANGKLDRARLPDVRHAVAGSSSKSAETTEMEGVVADVWRTSLDHEDIGFDENFFDVGGNSVRLIAVHRAIEARIGRRIPIVELFQHPTIRSLGDRLATLAQVTPTAQGAADQQLSEGRRRLVALQRLRMAGSGRAEAQRSDTGSDRPNGLYDDT